MPRPSIETVRGWRTKAMVDREGAPLGRIVHIYLDRVTGEPEWALVAIGQVGRQVFVPLVDAAEQEDQIRVPVERALVSDAPAIRPGRQLSEEATARLHGYYGGAPKLRWASATPGARLAADRPPVCGECWAGLASGPPARWRWWGPRVPGGCWPPGRLPHRWPAVCCWRGAAGSGDHTAWPSPSVGPLGGWSRYPPGRCAGGAAGGGCVPWPGRRPHPWPRQGGPSPGPDVASRSRPGRPNQERREPGGHGWQAT
jgi:hypothetical protein